MKIDEVEIEPAEGHQLIVGQAHFIKSVEDIYEALATAMPGLKFGVAFVEASGKALVRFEGSDEELARLASQYAAKIGAGHSFVVVLSGAFPINVLNRLKAVEEVTHVFCATSNKITVVVADAGGGRGVLGVVDGISPKGVEGAEDKEERRAFLRKIGYKR
ncbi:MAG TPA: adenosine-specific kinase [Nitrososphaerales archaeon]|nr:adenosine-specific kinase [Nitrososphaerales archaeon]